ncbi:hypothetical protein C8J56DRAFT_1025113 [Mycena floridula]|nr:hypothetical protein C8J56DRAFT_1025113 [Mycena floridula]
MAIFPAELFLEILPWVPAKADLLSFRGTSKRFGSLATRQAFTTISVDFDKQTALGFIALQNSHLAKHVKKVEFLGGRGSSGFYVLCLAFSSLAKFPALRMLTLRFTSRYMENDWMDLVSTDSESCSLSLLFQRRFLTAIADISTALNSLTTLNLLNLIAAESKILYTKPSFCRFISIPKHLAISVLWEEEEDDDDSFGCCGRCRMTQSEQYAPRLQRFWRDHITKDIMATVSRSRLVSLNLQSSDLVSGLACGTIMLPRLKKLSLTKVMFDLLQGSVEDFILRHKSTLKHLTLRSCPVFHTEDDRPRHLWSDIWDRLADGLDQLVSFATDKAANRYAFMQFDRDDFRYNLQMHGGKELEWEEDGPLIREDKEALDRFRSVVKTRRVTAAATFARHVQPSERFLLVSIFDVEHAQGFIALRSNDLTKLVETVEFVGKSGPDVIFLLQEDSDDEFDSESEYDSDDSEFSSREIRNGCIKVTTDALCLAFSGLDKFSALKELKLESLPNYLEKTWGDEIPDDSRGCIGHSNAHYFQQELLAAVAKTSFSFNFKLSLLNLSACFCRHHPQAAQISVIWKENMDEMYSQRTTQEVTV